MRSVAIPIAHPLSLAMTPDERTFFQTLGARIAQARKDAGLTQVQLAERPGIPQPQLASYEVGRRRVPVSRLQQQVAAISQLPKAKQKFVVEMLDTVLAQHVA